MKNEGAINIKQIKERIESNKKEFCRHQGELAFGEKIRIAFSLAERDKTIRGFSREDFATLKMHLEMIKGIQGKMK